LPSLLLHRHDHEENEAGTKEEAVNSPTELVDRYVAVWNEPEPERRRALIAEVWSDDAQQILDPPVEIRDSAASLGFAAPALEARGHEELVARVTRAYESFVEPGEFAFRTRGNAARLRDVVKFNWEMVRRSDGEIAATGLNIFVVDDDGRIRTDYQFVES
jgi:hypothetical protein